jgi:hypothetical protein
VWPSGIVYFQLKMKEESKIEFALANQNHGQRDQPFLPNGPSDTGLKKPGLKGKSLQIPA